MSGTGKVVGVAVGLWVAVVAAQTAIDYRTQINGGFVAGPSLALKQDLTTNPPYIDIDSALICTTVSACQPTGRMDLSQSAMTFPVRMSQIDPPDCTEQTSGQMYWNSQALALRVCAGKRWRTLAIAGQ
jgi:hypothetical protein